MTKPSTCCTLVPYFKIHPGQVKTIDIHPLMLAIIGLKGPAPTDGDASKLADFLYTERSNQSCLQQ
jgi:hypothetical protein